LTFYTYSQQSENVQMIYKFAFEQTQIKSTTPTQASGY